MTPLLGERRDRPTYRILDRLGDGRGDDVFLAHHEIFDGRFVQKTVHMHGLEDALANEPAFLNRLEHAHIVPVREAQWDPHEERAITFVMPHLAGGSIDDALREDYRFALHQCVTIAIDALDALAYVHRNFNALHRDTKPGNILLDGDRGHGYLTDFGSAASMDGQGEAANVLGTNVYRPPESRLTGRIGVRADLYGVGMTLFEMLNGRIAWETLDLAAVEARLQKGWRAVPDSTLTFQAHVPDRLRRCVRKAINRSAGDRYATAEEFIRALRRVRCVDWRHVDGGPLEGTWIGTWPPQRRVDRRDEYRVQTRVLEAGRNSGRLRLEGDYRRPGAGTWRQTVGDATIEPGNAGALTAYFEDVEASARHRSPAR